MLQESQKAQNRFMRESWDWGLGWICGSPVMVRIAASPRHEPPAIHEARFRPQPPTPSPLSGRLWVVLHQAEDVAFGVLAIGEPTYAWDRHFGDNALSAVGVHGL